MPFPAAPRRSRVLRAAAVLATVAVLAAACDGSGFSPTGGGGSDDKTTAAAATEAVLSTNVADKASGVPVDKVVKVSAEHGKITDVVVRSKAGKVSGRLVADGSRWVSTGGLEPGVRYRVRATAQNGDGKQVENISSFTTQALSLDQQTYPSVAPLQGETVGIGMPVIVTFDLPVTDKASFERHMKVATTPVQQGSWRWVSDTVAHWRPKAYWKAGTKVSVDIGINGVAAGGGIYGQEDRKVDFKVGDAHVYKVNAATHQMKVFSNGKLLRTLPITTGKPGFTTRSGVKVIMEKFATRRMNSETVGIPQGSAEAYDINDVRWAMRLTNSGEFIHAAPWSVGSQGRANVSHGCTGLSTDNASWLYDMTRRGDVVTYTGTDRPMEPDNGYGDWNIPWKDYVAGSALH
ncbi:L,D-transpeptidase [Pimelobacter simplex]|uniref:L,D-transpeptidase n=1 Tax=Nocardioides simplex TaxID=2045 RepID=UPI0021505D04|nr:Ig-like domain-containing protein [Pimelobacter simplex]UUW87523.1 Ig-like domain-containing protein [Pimelobacter simplex]UUW97029.1 Ig-like domain-containing protein [Pimelobacter simplex]